MTEKQIEEILYEPNDYILKLIYKYNTDFNEILLNEDKITIWDIAFIHHFRTNRMILANENIVEVLDRIQSLKNKDRQIGVIKAIDKINLVEERIYERNRIYESLTYSGESEYTHKFDDDELIYELSINLKTEEQAKAITEYLCPKPMERYFEFTKNISTYKSDNNFYREYGKNTPLKTYNEMVLKPLKEEIIIKLTERDLDIKSAKRISNILIKFYKKNFNI